MHGEPKAPEGSNVVSAEEFDFLRRKRDLEKRVQVLNKLSGALYDSLKPLEDTNNVRTLGDIDRLMDIMRSVDQGLEFYLHEKPPFVISQKIAELTPENVAETERLVAEIEKGISTPKYQELFDAYVQDINNALPSAEDTVEIRTLFNARRA